MIMQIRYQHKHAQNIAFIQFKPVHIEQEAVYHYLAYFTPAYTLTFKRFFHYFSFYLYI